MIMQLEAVVAWGATLMIWKSGRRTLAPMSFVPETSPSHGACHHHRAK